MGAAVGSGRKVIPIDEKKAKGTYRAYREKPSAPTSKNKPIPPAWLNKRAKQIFHVIIKRIDEVSDASRTHTEGIALLAARQEEVERLSKFLDDNGLTYQQTTREGIEVTKRRPEADTLDKSMRHLHTLLAEFGLTLSTSSRLPPKKIQKKKNEFDGF